MIKKYDELLESMGFKEKDFEKLNKYIHNHTTMRLMKVYQLLVRKMKPHYIWR